MVEIRMSSYADIFECLISPLVELFGKDVERKNNLGAGLEFSKAQATSNVFLSSSYLWVEV